MSYFEKIKKISFKDRVKKDSSKLEFDAERDWFLILGIFTLVISTILIYGVYSVAVIDKRNIHKDSDSMVIETINREKLKNTLKEYKQKNLLFEEVLFGGVRKSADPSL